MGRPKKELTNITINDIKINFISEKKDKYDNEITYFKVVDKNRFNQMLAFDIDLDLMLPYFVGDNGAIILKVKSKFINSFDEGCVELTKITYLANLHFEYYSIFRQDQEPLNGYYCKLPILKVSPIQSV